MVEQDLEGRFKDPGDPLRIAFVCAMWTTGFDVPSCSTIYLDKPMKNHSLMQTIARANRVFPEKTNGLIVDYIGVFRNLEAALALYAGSGRGAVPVQDKSELVVWLRAALAETTAFCQSLGIELDDLLTLQGFELVAAGDAAVERILVDDETKRAFTGHVRLVDRLFKAVLPDPLANEFGPRRAVLVYLSQKLAALDPTVDVSELLARVERVLDESVAANAYVIKAPDPAPLIDLNEIDWEALARRFATGQKRTEVEKLRALVSAKVALLARLNPTREDWAARFQQLIDDYNAGSANVEEFFQRLVAFSKELNEEERRGLAENLDEEQLAIYDLLMRPAPELTEHERAQVKSVAQSLLETLVWEKLVLDWRKEQRSRAAVRLAVEEKLDELPAAFTADLFATKCDLVYEHVYESYWDDGRSVYRSSA